MISPRRMFFVAEVMSQFAVEGALDQGFGELLQQPVLTEQVIRHYGQALAQALGFTDGKTPCAATLYTVYGCTSLSKEQPVPKRC